MFRFDDHYEVKKMGEGRMDHIVFGIKSRYPGLEMQYGKVQLIEEDNSLRVKFEYELFVNPGQYNRDQAMNDYLGQVLVEMMQQELTYAEALGRK